MLLSLGEIGDIQFRRIGCTVKVLRPAGEALLDLCLRRCQRLRERGGDRALTLRELAAVVLGELTLLLDEQGHGVGTRARECALELGSAIRSLSLDEFAQASLRLVEVGIHLLAVDECLVQCDRCTGREQAAGEPCRRDSELARQIRGGDVPPGTLQRVKADVEARLRIASPSFLEKYR